MKSLKDALHWLEVRAVPALLVVLGLALGLRVAVLLILVIPDPSRLTRNVDAKGYEILASNLLNGNGFSASETPPFVPELLRTPGYPLVIAAIYGLAGTKPVAIALIQILLDVGSVLLLYLIGSTTGSRAIGVLSSCTRALDPAAVALCNSLMSETLFVFLLLMSLFFVHRVLVGEGFGWASAVWIGVATAACALVRPVGLFYGLVIAGFLLTAFWNRVRKSQLTMFATLYLVTFGFLLSPWVARNYVGTGAFFFSTASSYNLLFENAVYVEAAEKDLDPEKISVQRRQTFSTLSLSSGWNQYESTVAMRDTALSILFRNWQTTAVLLVKGVGVRLIAPHRQEYGILLHGDFRVSGSPGVLYTSGLIEALKRFVQSPGGTFAIVEALYVLIVLILATIGFVRGIRSKLRPLCLLNLLVAIYFLFIPGMLLLGRMRAPAMPSLGLLAAVGMSSFFRSRLTQRGHLEDLEPSGLQTQSRLA